MTERRQAALIALVSQLRAKGQYPGRYVYTQPPQWKRDKDRIKRDLATAHIGHRMQDWRDDSKVASVRRGNVAELRRRA
jgi:hypothetical protein